MFLVDISPSMAKVRTVDLPGEDRCIEMTNLEWALQFVKLKIQEMVRTTALTSLYSAYGAYVDFRRTEDGPMWGHHFRVRWCVFRVVMTSES